MPRARSSTAPRTRSAPPPFVVEGGPYLLPMASALLQVRWIEQSRRFTSDEVTLALQTFHATDRALVPAPVVGMLAAALKPVVGATMARGIRHGFAAADVADEILEQLHDVMTRMEATMPGQFFTFASTYISGAVTRLARDERRDRRDPTVSLDTLLEGGEMHEKVANFLTDTGRLAWGFAGKRKHTELLQLQDATDQATDRHNHLNNSHDEDDSEPYANHPARANVTAYLVDAMQHVFATTRDREIVSRALGLGKFANQPVANLRAIGADYGISRQRVAGLRDQLFAYVRDTPTTP
jgi:DNA-directed RNA polymerase sigma subunit (sigma70/sigma32)